MGYLSKHKTINFLLYFAITAWPFFNFYASKVNYELISLKSYFLLFCITYLAFYFFSEITRRVLKISYERFLVIYLFFVLFFFSSHKFWKYANETFLTHIPLKPLFYGITFLIIIFPIYKLSKFESFRKSCKYFIIIVFSFSFCETLFISWNAKEESSSPQQPRLTGTLKYNFKKTPNIYYLLLDAYAGRDILKEETGFDNSGFLNFLENQGFLVAKKAYSNYTMTKQSLSGTFGMKYLDNRQEVNTNDVLSPDKRVFKILRDNGYKFIILPGYYPFIAARNAADISITPNFFADLLRQNIHFLRETLLEQFELLIRPLLYVGLDDVKKVFNQAPGERKFVFIHYLSLHDWAYARDGNISTKLRPDLLPYEHHLSSMNNLVKESIKEIRKNDPSAIILAQGDHGPMEQMYDGVTSFWRPEGEKPTNPKNFDKIFSILSAFYIPDIDKKGEIARYLSGSPSPINNFFILFSYLSGSPLKLLYPINMNVPYLESESCRLFYPSLSGLFLARYA